MSNQGGVQQSIRDITGTAWTWEGDWHALFDLYHVPAGTWNERLLQWLNEQLGAARADLPGAMQAFAEDQGFLSWTSMTSMTPTPWFDGVLAAGSRVAYIGDSLMAANHITATGVANTNDHGEVTWARAYSPRFRADSWAVASSDPILGRALDGADCAVQGAQVESVQAFDLAEQLPLALAYDPRVIVISGGVNDLSASDTAVNVMAELTDLVEQCLSRGIRVVLGTVRPRAVSTGVWVQGGSGWTELLALNELIRAYAASTDGVYLWDPWGDLVDPEAAQEGAVIDTYVYDGLHLNATGAQISGVSLAAVIAAVIEDGVFFDQDATNLIPNPAMTGTGGTKTAGVTGDVATGWTVQHDGAEAGNVSAVCSKISGDTVQQIVFTSDGLGATVEGFPIITNPFGISVPDDQGWYQYCVPVEFDASTLWRSQHAFIQAMPSSRSQFAHNFRDSVTTIGEAWSGWLVTEPFQIPAGTTSIAARMRIVLAETIEGSATMRILPGAQLSKVPAPS